MFYGQLALKTIQYIYLIDVVPGLRLAEYHLDVLCPLCPFPRIGYPLTTLLLRWGLHFNIRVARVFSHSRCFIF